MTKTKPTPIPDPETEALIRHTTVSCSKEPPELYPRFSGISESMLIQAATIKKPASKLRSTENRQLMLPGA